MVKTSSTHSSDDTRKKGSKRMRNARASVDNLKLYTAIEAIEALKTLSSVKFNETLDVAVSLDVDTRQSDQAVRGVVSLPHGIGKTVRVAVFCRDAKAEEAQKAGADIVGSEELIERINQGKIEFDRCVATPDMMQLVGTVAKILGPKGLMPNPKLGTVTHDVANAVALLKAGQVEFKAEKNGIVHAGVGKLSFEANQLADNLKTFVDALVKAKPATVKGTYIKQICLASTMGAGLKLDITSLLAKA